MTLYTFADLMGDYLSKAAGGHKYLRRVPTGNPKKPWRYYYTASSIGRGVEHGEEVVLGDKKVKVEGIEDGHVTISHADGKRERLSTEQWHDLMHEHHGEAYTASVDKRARQWANAVYRHVPREILADLQGSTDAERLANLKERAPEVYAKLSASFQRAGVRPEDAKGMVAWVLQRKGWSPDARASLLGAGSDLASGAKVVKAYREIAAHAQAQAAGQPVGAEHVAEGLAKHGVKAGTADGGKTPNVADDARDKLKAKAAAPEGERTPPALQEMNRRSAEDEKAFNDREKAKETAKQAEAAKRSLAAPAVKNERVPAALRELNAATPTEVPKGSDKVATTPEKAPEAAPAVAPKSATDVARQRHQDRIDYYDRRIAGSESQTYKDRHAQSKKEAEKALAEHDKSPAAAGQMSKEDMRVALSKLHNGREVIEDRGGGFRVAPETLDADGEGESTSITTSEAKKLLIDNGVNPAHLGPPAPLTSNLGTAANLAGMTKMIGDDFLAGTKIELVDQGNGAWKVKRVSDGKILSMEVRKEGSRYKFGGVAETKAPAQAAPSSMAEVVKQAQETPAQKRNRETEANLAAHRAEREKQEGHTEDGYRDSPAGRAAKARDEAHDKETKAAKAKGEQDAKERQFGLNYQEHERHVAIKGDPARINMAMPDGKLKAQANPGTLHAGLGVHKNETGNFTITHHNTGMALTTTVPTEKRANELRGHLAATGVDWEGAHTTDKIVGHSAIDHVQELVKADKEGRKVNSTTHGFMVDKLAEKAAGGRKAEDGAKPVIQAHETDLIEHAKGKARELRGRLDTLPTGASMDTTRQATQAAEGHWFDVAAGKSHDEAEANHRNRLERGGFSADDTAYFASAHKDMINESLAQERKYSKSNAPAPVSMAEVVAQAQDKAPAPAAGSADDFRQRLAQDDADSRKQGEKNGKVMAHARTLLDEHDKRFPRGSSFASSNSNAAREHLSALAMPRGGGVLGYEQQAKDAHAKALNRSDTRPVALFHKGIMDSALEEGKFKGLAEKRTARAAEFAKHETAAKAAVQGSPEHAKHAHAAEALTREALNEHREVEGHYGSDVDPKGYNTMQELAHRSSKLLDSHADARNERFGDTLKAKSKGKTGTIQVAVRTPNPGRTTYTDSKEDKKGTIFGGLGIHKDDNGEHVVTHMASGLRVGAYHNKSKAEQYRGLLVHTGVDWEKHKTGAEVMADPNAKHIQGVREAFPRDSVKQGIAHLPAATREHIAKRIGLEE